MNQYVVFFLALFVLWQIISFYRNPVNFKDDLVEINMQLNGISFAKKNGLEYASFNNCINKQECRCKVLIHGIGDNLQNWSKVLKKIKKNNKIQGQWVAINYPGTGQSDPLPSKDDFHIKKFSSLLNQKMKPICSGPYDLIANSMGTWISFWWAIQYPQNISTLFLMDAVGIYADYTKFADSMVNPTLPKVKKLHELGYHKVIPYPEFIYQNTIRNIKKRGNREFILAQDTSLAVDEYLPDLKIPTFIGWGESDKVLPKKTFQQYLDIIPNSKGIMYKNCGHIPNSECPEQVVKSIEDFYSKL